ncbi:MAG: hydroxymethylbilane synthase [Saprospiraceae bacterium]|nr:hydroxymethylbilane synthase [Saprospiraceae bacterium]
MKKIKIGTRGSELALWQAHYLQQQLSDIGHESELIIIKTKGDQIQHLSFDKLEGKGFFTKELEDALLADEVDVAVHSMKDVPTNSPEGLVIAGVSYREDPSEYLLIRKECFDENQVLKLKQNAIVGTSSSRRKSQMLDIRNDVTFVDIRGNVPTRINKLRTGVCDALLLASAGINRLKVDISDLEVLALAPEEFVPAPAQGVLAYQCKEANIEIRKIIKQIHHPEVAQCTNVERKVLNLLNGGCQMPLGVFCKFDANNNFHVWASKANAWNEEIKKVRLSSSTSYQLAEQIVELLSE